jgi:hypothetical protein
VAFLIRVWGLSSLGDLDFDEQASYFISSMPLSDMLAYVASAPFEHPPVYYALFHFWLQLVGGSEVAMRLSSVLVGTATVPMVGMLLTRAASTRAGYVGAATLAILPLHVYYSRDARMYPFLGLLVAGMLALAMASPSGVKVRSMLAAGTVGLIAVATHYFALFALVGLTLGLLPGSFPAHRAGHETTALGFSTNGHATVRNNGSRPTADPISASRPLLAALAMLVLTGAFIAFWFVSSPGFRVITEVVRPRSVPPDQLFATLAEGFATLAEGLGANLAGPTGNAASVLGGVALFGFALVIALQGRSGGRLRWLAAGVFLVVGVTIPLLILIGRPFAPRYVAMTAPAAAVLVALASQRLRARVSIVGVLVLSLVCAAILMPFYGAFMRSDYGRGMDFLRARAQPQDAIVLNGPWQDLLYRRYGGGLPPHYFMTSRVPTTSAEAIPRLEQLTATHPRVWVLDSATDLTDPEAVVATWLDAHAYPGPVTPFQKVLLRPYRTTSTGEPSQTRELHVSALELEIDSVALDDWGLSRGQEARLLLRTGRVPEGGTRRILARLVNERGETVWHWDGVLTPQGEGLRFGATLVAPSDNPPGRYRLEALVYEPEGDQAPGVVRRISSPIPLGVIEIR